MAASLLRCLMCVSSVAGKELFEEFPSRNNAFLGKEFQVACFGAKTASTRLIAATGLMKT